MITIRPLAVALVPALVLCACQSQDLGPATGGLPTADQASHMLGLSSCRVVRCAVDPTPGRPVSVMMPIEGMNYRVDLEPHSVRAEGYRVLVQRPDGRVESRRPGRVRTYRGTVPGRPRCGVAAAMLGDGLHVTVQLEDGRTCWMTPLEPRNAYAVYTARNVLPVRGVCRTPGADEPDRPGGRTQTTPGGPLLIARLACDTDTEFVAAQGSPSAVEARINAIINSVNLQYESQVGIRHEIATIVIRESADPYTATEARSRLCEFIEEWTSNRSDIDRDLAHLFTGANLSGSTIGIASDIGGTGVCVSDGGCRGGRFGTFGSYCLAQTDFSPSFACLTDLTAHELGHLWGAFHCTCPTGTMNASVTCSNTFSRTSIRSILGYRDTLDCLEEADAE